MNKLNKVRFIPLFLILLLVVMMALPSMSIAAQPTVNLGTTSSFAILAGSTITNSGTTTINGDAGGDVGLFPGSSFVGQAGVTTTGTVYLSDGGGVASDAKDALVFAYNDAAGRAVDTPIAAALGGGMILTPGTYNSASSIQINGTLTLDAQGDPNAVFVFQAGSTLTTASDSNILLTNGARYCRIFWQVGTSATLGTDSHFVGHIFAMESITANNGATVQGQLLARTGAVTLENNTITNGICATIVPPPVPATLNVIKHVINDNGRTAVAANFNIHVKSSGIDVATSPAPGVESPGTTYTLAAGTYVISEDAYAGYTASFSGDSDASGNITLAAGDNKTVTITNNDIRKSSSSSGGSSEYSTPIPPLIRVTKIPNPLALPNGSGIVTYTYTVTNPGTAPLSNVSVTDDKLGLVHYVSGDINNNGLLEPNETWKYTFSTTLTNTTVNTATATGQANGLTATHITNTIVVVGSALEAPLINVTKIPNPLALPLGSGAVTYTYSVTNPGRVPVSNVSIMDNKISSVKYKSGDVNGNNLLEPNETWIYTAETSLQVTTMNSVTVSGTANGFTVYDTAFATVVVTPQKPIAPKLPKTGIGTNENNDSWQIPAGFLAMGLFLFTLNERNRIKSSK